jgi:hypothetical protein
MVALVWINAGCINRFLVRHRKTKFIKIKGIAG